jgi:hypothetical protein
VDDKTEGTLKKTTVSYIKVIFQRKAVRNGQTTTHTTTISNLCTILSTTHVTVSTSY